MANPRTFLPVHECIGNTALPVGPGCYVVVAITPDGESPFCEAVCVNQPGPPILLPPDMDLQCVNYYLVDRTLTHSNFTWDPYPGALSYNVYVAPSSDPTNFVLDRSNIPVSTLEIAHQAVIVTAVTLSGETPKCDPIVFSANCDELDEWLARVASNGGITPPIEEQFAVCDFISALKDAGLWDLIYALNYFSPNGRITALTWLKQGPFSDTWTWDVPSGLGTQTFTVDGFNPGGRYAIFSGISSLDLFSQSDCGITGYSSLPGNVGKGEQSVVGPFASCKAILGVNEGILSLYPYVHYRLALGGIDPVFGSTWADCYKWGSDIAYNPGYGGHFTVPAQQVTHKGCGYVSLNRINSFDKNTYYAASDCPHQVVIKDGHNTGGGNGQNPDGPFLIFGETAQHNQFIGTCSMLAFHHGFGEGQSKAFFHCIQNFRIALGGGYV